MDQLDGHIEKGRAKSWRELRYEKERERVKRLTYKFMCLIKETETKSDRKEGERERDSERE